MSTNATPGIGHNSSNLSFADANRRIKAFLAEKERLLSIEKDRRLSETFRHAMAHAGRLCRQGFIKMKDGRQRMKSVDGTKITTLFAIAKLASLDDGHCYASLEAIAISIFGPMPGDQKERARRRNVVDDALRFLESDGCILIGNESGGRENGRRTLRIIAPVARDHDAQEEREPSGSQPEGMASGSQPEGRAQTPSGSEPEGQVSAPSGSQPEAQNVAPSGSNPPNLQARTPEPSGCEPPKKREEEREEDDMACHGLADDGATDLGLPEFMRPAGQGYVANLRWRSKKTGAEGEKDFSVPVSLVKQLRARLRISDREARVLVIQTLEDWRARWVTGRKDQFLPSLLSDAVKLHEQLAEMEFVASEPTSASGMSEEARRIADLLDSIAAADQELADEALREQAEEERRRGLH